MMNSHTSNPKNGLKNPRRVTFLVEPVSEESDLLLDSREHSMDENNDSSMQSHVIKLLEFFLEKDLSSIESDCKVDIFCMLSSDNGQGSFTFDKKIYEKLMNAGLSITFDFYSD